MQFFTSDQHYFHTNIIKYSNRPFENLLDMHDTLIKNHNDIVSSKDVTIHAGDFSLGKREETEQIIRQLNGHHIFLNGSHDYWLKGTKSIHEIWEKSCYNDRDGKKYHIIACHYCMRTWSRSHYNSWHVYGHSHGSLPSIGKSHDVGVDNNNFYPVSLEKLIEIMNNKEDNPNLIKK
jgi:calcineurin-like phosphoesterase family protein